MDNILLRYNGTAYTRKSLLNPPLEKVKGTFERSLFTFLRDWLSGQQTFQISTSGSTGTPKWITVHRGQMIQSALATNAFLGLGPGMNGLLCLSPDYIAGKMMCTRCLVAGATLLAVEPSSQPLEAIPASRPIDLAAMIPMQVKSMLEGSSTNKFDTIKTLLIGGGALDSELERKLKDVRTRCFATFGMTETLSHVALRQLNGENPENTYHALPGIRFEADSSNCLLIHAPFLKEPVTTRDVVELITPTEFRWLGRIDGMINSGGIKLLPEVLEEKLALLFRSIGCTRRFFITAKPDQRLGHVVQLIVEGEPLNRTELDRITTLMKSKLHRFEVPKEINFVTCFVETATGKIDRSRALDLIGKEGPAGLS